MLIARSSSTQEEVTWGAGLCVSALALCAWRATQPASGHKSLHKLNKKFSKTVHAFACKNFYKLLLVLHLLRLLKKREKPEPSKHHLSGFSHSTDLGEVYSNSGNY